MERCTKTKDLEVYHKDRRAGNGIDNAKVLCPECNEKRTVYGLARTMPPPFDEDTKGAALKNSGHQCECTSGVCH